MLNDLFISLFRIEKIKNKIFKEIKEINKQSKLTAYNFYDFPITSIIKTKNEIMLNQRLDLFIKYMDPSSNDIYGNDKSYHYYIDFNGEDYIQLLNWSNLSIQIFKKYFQIFKNEIFSIKLNHFFIERNRNLILGNCNIEILLFLKEQFIENKNNELNPTNKYYAFGNYNTFQTYSEIFLLDRKTPCTSMEFQMFLKLFNGLVFPEFAFSVWSQKMNIKRNDLKLDYYFSSPFFFNSKKSIIYVEEFQQPSSPPPPPPPPQPQPINDTMTNSNPSFLNSIDLVIDFFINSLNRTNKETIISLPIINKIILKEINDKPTLFFKLIDKILEFNDLILLISFLNLFDINETISTSTTNTTTNTTTIITTTTTTTTNSNNYDGNKLKIIEIYGLKILESTFNELFSQINIILLFGTINMFELFLIVIEKKNVIQLLNNLDYPTLTINCPEIARYLIKNFKSNSIKNNKITKTSPLLFTDSTLSIIENELFFMESKIILRLQTFKSTLTNEILIKFFKNGWIIKPNLMVIDFFGGDLNMVKTYLENSKTILSSTLIINSIKKGFYNVADYLLNQSLHSLENGEKLTILNCLKEQGNENDQSIIENSTNLIIKILNSFTIDSFIFKPETKNNNHYNNHFQIEKQHIIGLVKVLPFNPIQRKAFLFYVTNFINNNNNNIDKNELEYYKEIISDEFNSSIYIRTDKLSDKFKYLYKYIQWRFFNLGLEFSGVFKLDLQLLIDSDSLRNIKYFSNFDLLIILEVSLKEHYFSIIENVLKILESRIFNRGKNNKFQLKKRIIYNCFKLNTYKIPTIKSKIINKKDNNIKSLLFLIEIGFLKSFGITINNLKNNNRIVNVSDFFDERTINEKQSNRVIGDTFSFDLYYIIYKSIHTLNLKLLEILTFKNQSSSSSSSSQYSKLFIDQNNNYLFNVDKLIKNELIKSDKKTTELIKPLLDNLKNKLQ
ncbi:hypothetical protein ACTA71_001585 [Dictyostelium dimigraforme]